MEDPRQLAFFALRDVYRRGAFTDVALDRHLRRSPLRGADRRLTTELVYGCVRQARSLDGIIDRLAKKNATEQSPEVRILLHLGLYQLHYLDRIPDAAAVDTTVNLAKRNRLGGLSGFVNGLLRQSLRSRTDDLLDLPEDPVQRLGVRYSYPDWIVANWLEQVGLEETEQLCQWMNRTPAIDLRVNPLRSNLDTVESALRERGIESDRVSGLPQALRLKGATGNIGELPGFEEGWWTVQDSSAQLVSDLLDPQPGETVIDACAAPGGKTTHIAELMDDRGEIWGCDRAESRLRKVKQNAERLGLNSIQTQVGDARELPQFVGKGDRVLVDAPCSGLGTLHRRADVRWRQTPETAKDLARLQGELLDTAATWVKSGGVLVYATCTLHVPENERVVGAFLDRHPNWQIEAPAPESPASAFATPEGWIKVWSHRHQMDGFFMVRFKAVEASGNVTVGVTSDVGKHR